MKKRVKKKHRLRYWLRSPKEEEQIFREILQMFSVKSTPESTDDAKKELAININDYAVPLESVKPTKPVKAEVVTLKEQENDN